MVGLYKLSCIRGGGGEEPRGGASRASMRAPPCGVTDAAAVSSGTEMGVCADGQVLLPVGQGVGGGAVQVAFER